MARKRSKRSSEKSSASSAGGMLADMSTDRIIMIVAAAAVVLALAFLLYTTTSNQEREIEGLVRVMESDTLRREHVENAIYADEGLPPAGGSHANAWQNCGIYSTPINDENAVHSLEHGAVWIAYSPDLPEDQVETLQDKVSGESHLLLAPYPGLRSPVVLTAWTYQLEVDSADDSRIDDFIHNYQEGPQTPEPGARCDGGVGNPVG